MSTLNITTDQLDKLKQMKDQGKIAEVWNILGSKGDAYAFLAGAIVSGNTAEMEPIPRMFYEMVHSQWDNTVGPDIWGGSVFMGVGKQHLENYLTLLGSKGVSGAYELPDTIQIETSYKAALRKFGLPSITAIDSMFSVLDLAAGNGNGEILKGDFSWAQMMNVANDLMGGPTWENDRIIFNSEVFKDDLGPVTAVVTLGRTMVNTMERFDVVNAPSIMSGFAPTYWTFKLVDGVLDYTMMDFARWNAAHIVFNLVDKKLSPQFMDILLDASDNNDRAAFGIAIDRLGDMLGVALPKSNKSPAQIFDNVKTLTDSATFKAFDGQATLGLVDENLATSAKTGFSEFLSLYTLSPVIISTSKETAIAALKTTHSDLWADWSADKSARLYGDTSKVFAYSDNWYTDRTAMLEALTQRNQADISTGSSVTNIQNIHYWDATSQTDVLVDDPTSQVGILTGSNDIQRSQYLFGSSGSDNLKGNYLADHLYGGAGNDILIGQEDNDYLEGGSGDDTYQLQSSGGGLDRLFDNQGQDRIEVDGMQVEGVFRPTQSSGHNYYSADQRYQLQLIDSTTETWRLSMRDASTGNYKSLAELEGWKSGQYALILDNTPTEPVRINLGFPISVAYLNMDASGTTKGVSFQGGTKSDSFTGTAYSDVITTGDGLSNLVNTWGGDDLIVGGSGRDYVRTGPNSATNTVSDNDIAFGGEESDVLLGGAGEDQLWGGYDNEAWNTGGSNDRGDWLSGESGNDALTGSNRSDVLFGGAGEDILKGGNGADLLLGDAQYTPYSKATSLPYTEGLTQTFVWNSSLGDMVKLDAGSYALYPVMIASGNAFSWAWSITASGDFTLANPAGLVINMRAVTSNGGADWLDGGAGNDWLAGQTGDDRLWGGDGDDILYGDDSQPLPSGQLEGDDLLFAGAGQDVLNGNGGNDYLDTSDDDAQQDISHGGDGDDFLCAGTGHDELHGDAGNDVLSAGTDGDILSGGAGNDQLISAAGNDTLQGEAGDDAYYLSAGTDTAQDTAGNDSYYVDWSTFSKASTISTLSDVGGVGHLVLNGIILTGDALTAQADGQHWLAKDGSFTATRVAEDLSLTPTGAVAHGTVVVKNFFSGASFLGIELPAYVPPQPPANQAPVVKVSLLPQAAIEEQAFDFTLPADAFTDPDGQALTYAITTRTEEPLPAWLTWDATARTLSGTPNNADVGTLNLRVTATDTQNASASQTWTLNIASNHVADPGTGNATTGDDVLSLTTGSGSLNGGDGNDRLTGSWGNSVLTGGQGDDVLQAPGGPNNVLDGGDGNDRLIGGWGQDIFRAGEGNNQVIVNGGNAQVTAGAGNDTITTTWGELHRHRRRQRHHHHRLGGGLDSGWLRQ